MAGINIDVDVNLVVQLSIFLIPAGGLKMITLTFSDARAQFADVLNTAVDQPVTITRRTAPDVVVISAEQFASLQQAKFEASLARVMVKPENQTLFRELADK